MIGTRARWADELRVPFAGGAGARARAGASPPPRRARAGVALTVGVGVAAATLAIARATVPVTADFGVAWGGARALLAGLDPYASVGPGRPYAFPWPNLYPLTASIVQLPLATLPGEWARAVFAGATSALAAYGLSRGGWHRLAGAFLSAGALGTLFLTQWSFALVAAAAVPAVAWLACVKPNLGLACAAYWHTKRQWSYGVVGGAALIMASLVAWPSWPAEWLDVTRAGAQLRSPAATAGGLLVLALALLRWRRPEARMLAALVLVPQTPSYYDALLLFVVPATAAESLTLSILTWAAFFADGIFVPRQAAGADMAAALAAAAPARQHLILALLFLPCALMVLRRPNEGPVPAWLERMLPRRARSSAARQSAPAPGRDDA